MSTPRQRVRPSNSPMHNNDAHRKAREASLNALTGNTTSSPGLSSTMADSSVALGDMVNVPGDMYGTVKFVGPVRGKQGKFIGVELAGEFAARGKNDGDVDGIRYFDTDIPGAGIFLPVHRAEKRQSPARSRPAYPGTPTAMPKFSQSMGPGARPPSPLSKLKSRRPSLPRPESPFRKQPNLVPTPARNFSMSQSRSAAPSRPYSRTGSRVGNRPSTSSAASIARRSPSRQVTVDQDGEAGSLVEMEASLKEIQELIPGDDEDTSDVFELHKIQSLIDEFDAHRADFRSTIDTLELASAETERVYEAKIADLLAEIQELRELGHSREDVENVARQLKGLEELKAAKALQGAKEAEGSGSRDKDVELKDDEIRGLKAIIHSLSSGPESSPMARQSPASGRFADPEELKKTQATVQQLEREKSELQGLIDRKAYREEELERAVEQLRRAAEQERDSIMNTEAAAEEMPRHHLTRSPEAVRSPTRYRSSREDDGQQTNGSHEAHAEHAESEDELSRRMRGLDVSTSSRDRYNDKLEAPAPLSLRKTLSNTSYNDVTEKPTETPTAHVAEADTDKWCALCEKDGHLAFDCPDEQY
ncbi:unnamed protein product [Aureobasidium pullulans]|nr:unnamed protein product [Aureobasidium pullulans]